MKKDKYKTYLKSKENLRFKNKIKLLVLQFKKNAASYLYNINNLYVLFLNDYSIIKYMLCNYCKFDSKLKNWIKVNCFNKFNKQALIKYYMMYLCDYLTNKNNDLIKTVCNSFIESGLINNIYLENDVFYMLTNDNDIIKFSNSLIKKELIKSNRGICHQISQDTLINSNDNNLFLITVLENNLLDYDFYHSFNMTDNIVYDFTHNIIIKYDDYLKLIKPKVLLKLNKENYILKNNKYLYEDNDYKKSKINPALKLIIKNQLNKKNICD